MSTVRVLVCGMDFYRVEAALGGSVEKTNYAWNRRYEVLCTSTLGVDHVDSRLLSMCYLVVLTKGATAPVTAAKYMNKPTVSLDGAPDATVAMLKGCDFYYGVYAIENLHLAVVDIALSPPHVLWDAALGSLTEQGEFAFRRAFWLLDKDADGVLNEDELIEWQRSITSASFSRKDLSELFSAFNTLGVSTPVVDLDFFIEMQKSYLCSGDAQRVWATLHITGLCPDGLPYSWRDVHAVRLSKQSNTYLSHTAIQFFRNLYKLRLSCDLDNMWSVTPGCPWKHINGFQTTYMSLDKFIEYWKYMALVKQEVVVKYARYWGYKGDTSLLFSLRHARPYREAGEAVPNTIQVLVIGSPGCGRKSLMFALTALDDELYNEKESAANGLYVRTTTFSVRHGEGDVLQTVVYITMPLEEALETLRDEALGKQVDAVLLCYDRSRAEETTSYIMRAYLKANSSPLQYNNLPFVVVMTKAETCAKTASYLQANEAMECFCRQHRLLWPPVITSVEDPDVSEILALNEYMYAVVKEPEIAVGLPPLTPLRIARRVAIATVTTIALGSLLRWFTRRVCGWFKKKEN